MEYLKDELYRLQSESRPVFDFIQEAGLDGVAYWDLDCPNNIWLNPKCRIVLGLSPNEDLWKGGIGEAIKTLFAAHEGQPQFAGELPIKRLVGHDMRASCRSMRIEGDAGKRLLLCFSEVSGEERDLVHVFYDTEQTAMAEAVKKQNEQMEALLSSIDDLVFEIGEDMRFRHVWTTNEQALFMPPAQFLGKTIAEIFEASFADIFIELIKRAFASGERQAIEYASPYDDRWFEANINRLRTQQSVVLIIKDITKRKQAEATLAHQHQVLKDQKEALQASQYELQQNEEHLMQINDELLHEKHRLEITLRSLKDAKSQLLQQEKMAAIGVLAAGIAHEVNNPLNFISGGVQALKPILDEIMELLELLTIAQETPRQAARIEELTDSLGHIEEMQALINGLIGSVSEGVQRVASIIGGLKYFTSVKGGEGITANLHRNIDNVLLLLSGSVSGRVVFERAYDERCAIEMPIELSQAFLSVVNNAIEAIPNTGRVLVETNKKHDAVEIAFTDTGRGIPANLLPKVFDPFFTTKEVGQGVGLGLSVAHGIVKKHGGIIQISSEEGKGSKVKITLPVMA